MRSKEHEARASAGREGLLRDRPAALDHDRVARLDLLHLATARSNTVMSGALSEAKATTSSFCLFILQSGSQQI